MINLDDYYQCLKLKFENSNYSFSAAGNVPQPFYASNSDNLFTLLDTNEYRTYSTILFDLISKSEYDSLKTSKYLTDFDLQIIMENKQSVYGTNYNNGYFIVITDFFDAINAQGLIQSQNYNCIKGISVDKNWNDSRTEQIYANIVSPDFVGTIDLPSISEIVMDTWPALVANPDQALSTQYRQYIGIHVLKIENDTLIPDKMNITVVENFFGSLNSNAKDAGTGKTNYIYDIVNLNSDYIKVYTSLNFRLDADTTALYIEPREWPLFGTPEVGSRKKVSYTDIISSIDNFIETFKDTNEYLIDIVADFGLSTIVQEVYDGVKYEIPYLWMFGMFQWNADSNQFKNGFLNEVPGYTFMKEYDPTQFLEPITSSQQINTWKDFVYKYYNLCLQRGDCISLIDMPRRLSIRGDQKRVNKRYFTTFENAIEPQLGYLYDVNSEYVSLYVNWVKVYDDYNGLNFWIPTTCKIVDGYVTLDKKDKTQLSPTGLRNGMIDDALDISFNPDYRASDLLYKQGINYVSYLKDFGYMLEGNKTSVKKETSLNRINAVRSLKRVERGVTKFLKKFLYSSDNNKQKLEIENSLKYILNSYKSVGLIVDYKFTVNTDNENIKVSVALQLVRLCEFVIVEFGVTGHGSKGVGLVRWQPGKDEYAAPEEIIITIDEYNLFSSGQNLSGELGFNDNLNRALLEPVEYDTIRLISNGETHSIKLMENGNLYGSGNNINGQLGFGNNSSSYNEFTLLTLNNCSHISCGQGYSLAVKNDGTLWGCGLNDYGRIGVSSNLSAYYDWTQVNNDTNWMRVYAGYGTSFALKTDYTLWACGDNSNCQCGVGTNSIVNGFTQILYGSLSGENTKYIYVNSGKNHSVALDYDSNAYIWGKNTNGQFGDGSTINSLITAPQLIGSNYNSINCGYNHTIAVKKDGSMYGAGYNVNYELGLGNTTQQTTWQLITNNMKYVRCNSSGTTCIDNDYNFYIFGKSVSGCLSNGEVNKTSMTPRETLKINNYIYLDTKFKTLSLICDSVEFKHYGYSFGNNDDGELSFNDIVQRNLPSTLDVVISQEDNSFIPIEILRDNLTLYVFGCGIDGELGNGSSWSASAPVSTNFIIGN